MSTKKAKISLSPLFTDAIHTDEVLSDSPSPLTPLTPDLVISTPGPTPSTGFWVRPASQGFRLPGEPEGALVGPDYPGIEYVFIIRSGTQHWRDRSTSQLASTTQADDWNQESDHLYIDGHYQELAPLFWGLGS